MTVSVLQGFPEITLARFLLLRRLGNETQHDPAVYETALQGAVYEANDSFDLDAVETPFSEKGEFNWENGIFYLAQARLIRETRRHDRYLQGDAPEAALDGEYEQEGWKLLRKITGYKTTVTASDGTEQKVLSIELL